MSIDCGSDAHSHVLVCASKDPSCRDYFGTLAQFQAAQRRRMETELKSFLKELDHATRAHAIESIAQDIADMKINI